MNIKKMFVLGFSAATMAVFGILLTAGAANAEIIAPQISRDLGVGSVGEDVRSLQQFLNNNGYTLALVGPGSPGNETSIFGSRTQAALARFQAARGIGATGYLDSNSRSILFGGTGIGLSAAKRAEILAQIEILKQKIAELQAQLAALLASGAKGNPGIEAIIVSDGGNENYIDAGDKIAITFSKEIDPDSVNSGLEKGSYVTNVGSTKTGGISVSASGRITAKGIATFDAGTVDNAGTFTSKIALNSTGRILTITLSNGDDIGINTENLTDATQIGGIITDINNNAMKSDSSIGDPAGTFGGGDNSSDDRLYITAVKVNDDGNAGYIDAGDSIAIAFSKEVDPESINDDLSKGDYVTGIESTETGGVSVSVAGKVFVEGITTFDMGEVEDSGFFTSKLALNSTGRILTITLNSGEDIEIIDENLSDADQIGGIVDDTDGNTMKSDSSINDPTGTFGGDNDNSSESDLAISSINVINGENEEYIDIGDIIKIVFNEAINPDSINSNLIKGDYITNVASTDYSGVSVSASGIVTIKGIATFDIGTVDSSGTYTAKVALNSTGKILTITLTGGSYIEITNQSFDNATQIGGVIEDADDNEMDSDSSIAEPNGSF